MGAVVPEESDGFWVVGTVVWMKSGVVYLIAILWFWIGWVSMVGSREGDDECISRSKRQLEYPECWFQRMNLKRSS